MLILVPPRASLRLLLARATVHGGTFGLLAHGRSCIGRGAVVDNVEGTV
jgi:hypothetical protein